MGRLRRARPAAPGFGRVRRGRGFGYLDERGRPLRDEEPLARIRSLVIPPAWTEVWIAPHADDHIQVIGVDADGVAIEREAGVGDGGVKVLAHLVFPDGIAHRDADLAGPGVSVHRVYSAAEMIDHAADLLSDFARLVHDNERRWRVMHQRVAALLAGGGDGRAPCDETAPKARGRVP